MKRFVIWGFLLVLCLLRMDFLQGQNQNVTMSSQTITVNCPQNINFYDPGGPNGNYGHNLNITQTFVSSNPDKCLKVTFNSFSTQQSRDSLIVYDGYSVASGYKMAVCCGSLSAPFSFTSTTGALTFKFTSDGTTNNTGWSAVITCVDCPQSDCQQQSQSNGSPCSMQTSVHPFCTDENISITFPSGTNGSASSFFNGSQIGCLYSAPGPAWYYMQIDQPGDLLIRIQQNVINSTTTHDVDFICWGPFHASSQAEFTENLCCGRYDFYLGYHQSHNPTNGNHSNGQTGGYPFANQIDCSYSASASEWCYIPNAQHGEWYLLLMTNYSGYSNCEITFTLDQNYSTGNTNCNLLAPISYIPPCEGDTLVLNCENPVAGAVYHWWGPGGWSTTTTVPTVSIPNVTHSQEGTYYLHLTNVGTSVDTSDVEVQIYTKPNVTISTLNDVICEGESVQLHASGAHTYAWSTSATTANITVSPTTTTVYSVIGTSQDGCKDTAYKQVTVLLNSTGDTSAIACDSFDWYEHTGLTESGTYTHTFTNAAGCDSIVTLHLTVTGTLNAYIATDFDQICNGNSVTLTAMTGNASASTLTYLWNTGATTQSITMWPSDNAQYSVTITASAVCVDSAYKSITVGQSSYQTVFDTICRGAGYDNYGFTYTPAQTNTNQTLITQTHSYTVNNCLSYISLRLSILKPDTTHIYIDTCDSFTLNGTTYESSGTFSQNLQNQHGCDSLVVIHLVLEKTPDITVTTDANSLCQGNSLTLSATVGNNPSSSLSYQWNTGDNTATVTLTPEETMEYTVTVSTPLGCRDSASKTVAIIQTPSMMDYVFLCDNSTSVLTARPSSSYLWNTGETTPSILVSSAGTYSVDVIMDGNCPVTDTFEVFAVKVNSLAGVNIPDLCAGGSYPITMGQSLSNNIIFHKYETVQTSTDTVFLPDGVPCDPDGCAYRSHLNIGCFEDTTYISDVNDIRYVRLNLEHSYPGELYIKIVCPNQQKADILRFGETISSPSISECLSAIPSSSIGWQAGDTNAYLSTFFGLALDNHDSALPCDSTTAHNAPGVGWDYCWSNNSSEGYTYAGGEGSLIYRTENVYIPIEYNVFNYTYRPSDVAAGSQFYHPDESFQSLVGCPLNGDWYIEVVDGQTTDNGYLFEWEIAFASNLENIVHASVVQTSVEGPWITNANNNSFVVNPPANLPADTIIPYTLHCIGEYDCSYDTVVNIPFYTRSEETLDIVECNSFTYKDSTYTSNTTIHDTLASIHGCDSIVNIILEIIHAPEVTISGPVTFCPDSSAVLTAVTTETPISYLWNTGETTSSITVTESGVYTVTVSYDGGCTSESAEYAVYETENPILDVYLSDMVAGDTQTVVIGQQPGSNLQYVQSQSTFTLSETAFIPDGIPCGEPASCSYKAYLELSGFDDDAVIQSADDIRYLRLNMEHSAIVNLYIRLTCPNNQQVDILKKYNDGNLTSTCLSPLQFGHFGWSTGTNVHQIYGLEYPYIKAQFGNANPNSNAQNPCDPAAPNNQPGTGWNYCWSNNTTEGYQYAYGEGSLVYRPQNALIFNATNTIIIDSSNVEAGTHFYHPDVSFSNLVGCPLNGTWIVEVLDGTSQDNGYVFTSELAVADYLTDNHHSQIVENDFAEQWVTRIDDSTFIITPPEDLEEDTEVAYTFTLTDINGCTFDTTIYITIYAHKHMDEYVTIYDDELPFEWNDVTFTSVGCQDAVFQTEHGADSVVTMHLSVIYIFDTVVCETSIPFEWHNQTFYESTTLSATYPSDCEGADSIEMLILDIDPAYYDSTEYSICLTDLPYQWHGMLLDTPGTYYDTIPSPSSVCDSVMILHLTMREPTTDDTTATACESFTWHGETYTTSGDYPLLLVNAAGCDSIYTLHLTIYNAENSTLTIDTCDWYIWNDSTYTASGNYMYVHEDENGCTQVDTLHLTIHHATNLAFTVDTCDWYIWNGTTYTASGTYTYSFADLNGCTQVDTLHLTINHATNLAFTVDTCDWYTWNDSTYTASGTYTYSFADQNGCTQVDTLHLTINHATNLAFTVDTCDWYTWNGSTYTATGTYTYSFADQNGCTQVDTLHLTINHATNLALTVDTCDWYTWNGTTYTATGTYTYSFADQNGCTQVDTLYLTINHATNLAFTVDTCDWYTWNGTTYTATGTYTYSFADQNGCTQVDTLHLTINHATNLALTVDTCDWYTWNGTTYTTTGEYTYSHHDANGCLQVDTLHLTIHNAINTSTTLTEYDSCVWNGTTYTASGNYLYIHADENGCTQVDTLYLTIFYSSANEFSVSECDIYIWNDSIYTESGTFEQVLTDMYGADSLMILHLTINHATHVAFTVDTCDWYFWNDSTYTASGTYIFSHEDFNGCTQVDTLHLTINHATHVAYTVDTCDWYSWNGTTYTATGTYTYSFADQNGCTQVDTLHLTINHATNLAFTVDTCDWYTWNDSTYTASGTYTYSFADLNGCTQVDTLHLTINHANNLAFTVDTCDWYTWNDSTYTASGTYTYSFADLNGCTQVDTLHLTINHATNLAFTVDTCDWYTWNDSTYTATGTYTYSFADQNGCTQVDTLHLTINHATNLAFSVDTCDWYTWNDSTYTATGTYTYSFADQNGCTQVDTLHLTINHANNLAFTVDTCDWYTWNDSTYTATGTYTYSFADLNGCTQVDTLHLTINHATNLAFTVDTCDWYTWNDSTYTASGTYTFSFADLNGCTQVDTLHLTINHATNLAFTVDTCDWYTWNDSTYTASGTYTFSFADQNGCTQVDTLHLTINHATNLAFTIDTCDWYTWNDSTYTATGTYTFSHPDQNGCTQVDTLHLTINHATNLAFTVDTCDWYTWNDSTYTASGTYTFSFADQNGCTQVDTLHLTINHATNLAFNVDTCDWYTWNDSTYTATGTYTYSFADQNGCTQVDTLHLTINHATNLAFTVDTCDWYTWNDSTYTATGTYTYSFADLNGCTQVDTLHLTINHATNLAFTVDTCDWYTWNDSTYTATGTYTYSFADLNGCTQVDTLHLTINHATNLAFTVDTCDWYTWNDSTYTASGTYTYSFADLNGCTQVDTLHLTINHANNLAFAVDTCDWYIWNDSTYTASGTYTFSHPDQNGCTQVDTLHLIIYNAVNLAFTVDTCDWYTWNDSTYTASGTYTFSFADQNGCTQVDTLHLTINHATNLAFTVDTCDWYTWNDSTYTASGTYTYSFADQNGCTQVDTLHLTINHATNLAFTIDTCDWYTWNDSTYTASGTYTYSFADLNGCTQVDTLHLTINHATNLAFTVDTCDWYTWNDSTYTATGTYTFSFADLNGCTQVDTLHLTINHATNLAFTVDTCDWYTWNDSTYTATGTYTYSFADQNGCTQVDTLHLTINHATNLAFTVDTCDWYTWNGSTYTATGTYTYSFADQNGCTQVDTLHLTIRNSTTGDTTVIACDSFTWIDGVTYTQSTNSPTVTLTNAAGCDSVVTLHLTVNYSNTGIDQHTVCDSLTWIDGITYTQSTNTPTITLTNAAGCDSVVTLHLTVNHSNTGIDQRTVCDSFTWINGTTYTQSTDSPTVTLTNAAGCDSVVTLHLTVNHATTGFDTAVACDSYTWNGQTYTSSGQYPITLTNAVGCDSLVTLTLTVNPSYHTHDTLHLVQNQLPYYFAPSGTTIPVGSQTSFQFNYTTTAHNNCDSTVTEQVYIHMNYAATFDTTVCAAALPLQWHGHTFTASSTAIDSLHTVHGSDSVLTYIVTVDMLSAAVGNVTHVICFGQSSGAATMTVTGGTAPLTYQWTNGAGATVSSSTQISNQPAGNYNFTVTDAVGCSATVPLTLNTINGQMVPGTISGNPLLCFGDSLGMVTGTAAIGDGCVYQWQISTNDFSWNPAPGTNNTQNYESTTMATDNFMLRRAWMNGDCGTLYSDTLAVSVWPILSDTLYDDICMGEPYQQNGFNIAATETANTGTMTSVKYYASSHGCDSAVVLILTIHEPKETTLNTEICEGAGYFENGFNIPAQATVGVDTLLRFLTLQTVNNCDSVIRLEISVIDTALHIENLTADFCEEMYAELVAVSPMTYYLWNTGDQTPNVTVTSPGFYTVTASQGECHVMSRYFIETCEFQLYLPNAITPDVVDGVNDYFCIPERAQTLINLFEISIFNRWGQQVFYSTDKNFKWNGEIDGTIYYQNVYNYVIKYTDSTGKPYRVTGSITVL